MAVVSAHNHRSTARMLALLCSTALAGVSILTTAGLIATPALANDWTGLNSSDWFDSTNWSDGTVPTAADPVTIDTETPLSTINGGSAASGTVDVGVSGLGKLLIENGATLTSSGGPQSRVGFNAGANGWVVVNDIGSLWTLDHALIIGRSGTGKIAIGFGGKVGSSLGVVGDLTGAQGTATITGSGASWNNDGVLYVGNFGQGEMTIAYGGAVTSTVGGLGGGADAVGTVTVTGTDSRWEITDALNIGNFGDGSLAIEGGGAVTSLEATLGLSAGGKGTMTVDGAGSVLNTGSNLFVGKAGTGALDITGGGEVVTGNQGIIGYSIGSAGTVNVTGLDSTWTLHSALQVGRDGAGELVIAGGGTVSVDATRDQNFRVIGSRQGSTGTVTVTGIGSTWNGDGQLNVGSDGAGLLAIEDGGLVSDELGVVGDAADGVGTAIVRGAGSRWNSSGFLWVGRFGTGALTVANGGTVSTTQMTIANETDGVGTLNIGAAAGEPAAAPGIIDTPSIILGEGDGTINFKHTASSYVFAPGISGAGTVNVLLGPTIFTGENTYTGTTNVIAGATLQIGNGGNTGSLASDAVVDGALIFDRTGELTYAGAISGSGRFSKRGAGKLTLTGDNETGLFTVHDGTLAVVGGTFDQLNTGAQSFIGESAGDDAVLLITSGGVVSTDNKVHVGNEANSQGSVVITGGGSSLNVGDLTVGFAGNGALSVIEGGHLQTMSFMNVGGGNYFQQGSGLLSISGTGSRAEIGYFLNLAGIGDGSTGNVTVSEDGMLSVGLDITLASGNPSGSADLNIGAASADTADAVAPGTLLAPQIVFYGDNARLNFNHTGDAYVFDTPLTSTNAGAGFVHHYAGVTSLTGDSSGFSGDTIVHGGTLKVNGALGGTVDVESGGTLGGSGTIGGNVDVDGILSAGNSPGTLTIAGDLTLNATSTSVFELNTPGVAGGTGNDLVDVGGNLTLGGALDARVAAAGYYRLFNYGGTRTGTFASGTLTGTGDFTPLSPNSPDVRYDIPYQVNLSVLGAGQTMQFWDGTDTTGNGTVDGGAGTWNTAGTNWTGEPGHADINGTWGGSVGVFAGAAGGAVTVDGTQSFDTLQFKTDGYTLKGGVLALTPASGTAGTLNIDNGVSAIIGSVIADGTGTGLKKTGGGTLKLAGANTYSGGTQLLGGVLWVSSNANLGDASGGLTFDGGTLRNTVAFATARDIVLGAGGGALQTDADLRVAGTISGGGSLTKTGAGRLRLTRANSYTGGTFINQGAVTAMVTDALGTGPVSMDKAFLAFTDSASAEDLEITNTLGGINFFDSASAGSATIVNDGGGTSFNGDSTAGNAAISAMDGAAINFYNNATAGGATISVANAAILFHGDNTADSATIINQADGLVDISDLTADGIAIGSLSGVGGVFLGSKALTLGGLGRSDTIGGEIFGSGGSLVKTGAGALTLNGVNTYTGLTTVDAGTLIAGDDTHASASLASTVTVMNGGTLGGIGTVGSTTIASGGTIAPGNSIGTLNVAGDITFAAGSIYEVEVDPEGTASDLIHATGTAMLNGGSVIHIGETGTYRPDSTYAILTADGGVTGTFADVTSNFAFLDPTLDYDASNVYLELTRNDVAFCMAGMTFNQCSTGNGVESTGPGSPIHDAIVGLSANEARAAFDMLSGEIYASAKSALIEDSHFVRDAVNARIRSAFGDMTAPSMPVMAYGEGGPRPASPDSFGPVAWGYAFGAWGSFDGDGNAAGLDTSTGGFLTGIDGEVAENIRLGLLAGYSHSSFEIGDRASSGSSDNYHLGLYAGGKWNALRLSGGLAYTWHDIETSRSAAFPGFSDSLSADYGAGTFQAFGEAGYRIDTGAVSFEPFANLAYVSLNTDGFTEKGGAAALHVRGATTDTTFSTLGIHLSSAFELGGVKATAHGTLGWRHAFGDTTPTSIHAFAGGGPFTIAGVPIAEDAAIIEAGLDVSLTDNATLGIAYQGQIASHAAQHGFNARLNVKF